MSPQAFHSAFSNTIQERKSAIGEGRTGSLLLAARLHVSGPATVGQSERGSLACGAAALQHRASAPGQVCQQTRVFTFLPNDLPVSSDMPWNTHARGLRCFANHEFADDQHRSNRLRPDAFTHHVLAMLYGSKMDPMGQEDRTLEPARSGTGRAARLRSAAGPSDERSADGCSTSAGEPPSPRPFTCLAVYCTHCREESRRSQARGYLKSPLHPYVKESAGSARLWPDAGNVC